MNTVKTLRYDTFTSIQVAGKCINALWNATNKNCQSLSYLSVSVSLPPHFEMLFIFSHYFDIFNFFLSIFLHIPPSISQFYQCLIPSLHFSSFLQWFPAGWSVKLTFFPRQACDLLKHSAAYLRPHCQLLYMAYSKERSALLKQHSTDLALHFYNIVRLTMKSFFKKGYKSMQHNQRYHHFHSTHSLDCTG